MLRYEFKVIPAPRRGEKARGLKSTEDRFALAMTNLMNEMGRDGWDYVRADTLPVDERSGLTGTKTSYQNLLVFRRPLIQKAVIVSEATTEAVFVRRIGPVEPEQGSAPPVSAAVGPAKPELAAE